MKATRKLLPAIALLLVSVVLLSTASFAWFTTNKTVKTSMTVSVTTPQNLMISVKEGDDWGPWANSAAFNNDYPKLTPASSANGKDFVVSSGLVTEGALTQDQVNEIVASNGSKGSFSTNTTGKGSEGEVYFLKYEFQLRASQPIVPSPEQDEDIVASNVICTIKVTGTEKENEEDDEYLDEAYFAALRIVILDSEGKVVVAARGASGATSNPIIKGENSTYTVSTTAFTGTNTFNQLTFPAAVAQDFTLVVWLEGNDPACVSENIDKTPNCNISIDFEVKDVEGQ